MFLGTSYRCSPHLIIHWSSLPRWTGGIFILNGYRDGRLLFSAPTHTHSSFGIFIHHSSDRPNTIHQGKINSLERFLCVQTHFCTCFVRSGSMHSHFWHAFCRSIHIMPYSKGHFFSKRTNAYTRTSLHRRRISFNRKLSIHRPFSLSHLYGFSLGNNDLRII